jgi:hypothetical protein
MYIFAIYSFSSNLVPSAKWTGSELQRTTLEEAITSGAGVIDLKITTSQLLNTSMAERVVFNVSYVSSRELVSAPILWPHAASKAIVIVNMPFNSSGVDSIRDGKVLAVFAFAFGEGVTETTVTASGYAIDDVMVTFQGVGFDVHAIYTCALVPTAAANATKQQHGCLARDVQNITQDTCIPMWNTNISAAVVSDHDLIPFLLCH